MDAQQKMELKADRRDRKVRGPKVVVVGLRATETTVNVIAKKAQKGAK